MWNAIEYAIIEAEQRGRIETEVLMDSEQEESDNGWADIVEYAVRKIEKGEYETAKVALRHMAECFRND